MTSTGDNTPANWLALIDEYPQIPEFTTRLSEEHLENGNHAKLTNGSSKTISPTGIKPGPTQNHQATQSDQIPHHKYKKMRAAPKRAARIRYTHGWPKTRSRSDQDTQKTPKSRQERHHQTIPQPQRAKIVKEARTPYKENDNAQMDTRRSNSAGCRISGRAHDRQRLRFRQRSSAIGGSHRQDQQPSRRPRR